jgi:uncharacterized membrane protein
VDALDGKEEAVTPTLIGRIQTRLLLAAVVGLPIALLVSALLAGVTALGAITALGIITLLGLAWEWVYDLIQQRRWDRDWPSSLALAAGVPEAMVAWLALKVVGQAPATLPSYLALFAAIWLGLWVAQQGPISVFVPQWRHHGARLTAERPLHAAARPAPSAVPSAASHNSSPRTPSAAVSALSGWLRPTPHRLVSVGVFASVIAALVVLAPMVGRDGDKASTAASPGHRARTCNPGRREGNLGHT